MLARLNILQARVITAQRDLISLLACDSLACSSLLAHPRQKAEPAARPPPIPKTTAVKN